MGPNAKAIIAVNLSRMLPIVKFTSNEWAKGDKMHAYFDESSACPFCGQVENMSHVFSCNEETPKKFRDAALTSLATKFTKMSDTAGPKWLALATK
jgi:hypothetical protein